MPEEWAAVSFEASLTDCMLVQGSNRLNISAVFQQIAC